MRGDWDGQESHVGYQLWEEAGRAATWPCARGKGREPPKPAGGSGAHSGAQSPSGLQDYQGNESRCIRTFPRWTSAPLQTQFCPVEFLDLYSQ